jgi:predicted metal-dependent hydrolase
MSFPSGEQYFIDSVRAGMKTLPADTQARLAREVQGFIGQEATHRRLHALFNGHLDTLGFRNRIEARALERTRKNAHRDVRIHIAATAATEHFTALFAEWMLSHPQVLASAEPRLQTLWLWHSAEESEHRSTAFDLYHAAGGNHEWRVRIFKYISVVFLYEVMRQTVLNLWHDGSWWRLSTWVSGWKLLMAKDGLFRSNLAQWKAYMQPDFHPQQQDDRLSRTWLQTHQDQFVPVGAAATH